MERKFVSLYGSRAGTLAIDLLEGIGPNGAGLLVLTVDHQHGLDPVTFALDPGGAGRAERAIRERREHAYTWSSGKTALQVPQEFEQLVKAGLPVGPLTVARDLGLLGVTRGSHLEERRLEHAPRRLLEQRS